MYVSFGSIEKQSSDSKVNSGAPSIFTLYDIGFPVGVEFVSSMFLITSSPRTQENIIGYGFGI